MLLDYIAMKHNKKLSLILSCLFAWIASMKCNFEMHKSRTSMLPHKQILKLTECCDRGADLLTAHRSNVVEAGRTKGAKCKLQVNPSEMMQDIEFCNYFLDSIKI
jgi:hypothetical protein